MSKKTTKESLVDSDAFKRLTHEFGSMTEQEAEAYLDGLRTDRPMVEMMTNVAKTIDGIGGMSGRQAVDLLLSALAQLTVGMATEDEASFMHGVLQMQGTLFHMVYSVGGAETLVQMLEVMQDRGALLKAELAKDHTDGAQPDDDADDIFTTLHKERQQATGSQPV
jgi:hypothetical protein